jgi:signal transduction histidine kinase
MQMFQSATLKLTAWYLAILMTISIIFSVVIYQLNFREISFRLENLQHSLLDDSLYTLPGTNGEPQLNFGPNSPLSVQSNQAAAQMISTLVYINLVILVAGGLGSYFLARRTLRPIQESHEAQSRFTSDASHELRTPLAVMIIGE